MVYKLKRCQVCGKEYRPASSNQKYCSECGPAAKAEVHKTCSTRWNKENQEKARAADAKYRLANPEKHKVCDSRWHWENLEKARAADAKFRRANREKRAVSYNKWRTLKYTNTPIGEMLMSTEWLAILAEAAGHCHYCDKEAKLTLDHVIPLSKGGKHSADNVVAACGHCNSSKGNKTLAEWQAKERRHDRTEARS